MWSYSCLHTEGAFAMALALPLLGLASASHFKPLHTSRPYTHTLSSPTSNSLSLPASCRLKAFHTLLQSPSSQRASSCRFALHEDDVSSSSASNELEVVRFFSVKSEGEHCSESGRSAEEALAVRRVTRGAALTVAGSLMSAGASLADEIAASPVDGSDVGISTTVSVLFVFATVGLVVLTGGVIYLGLTEFLEKRALQEEQKKAEEAKPKKPTKQTVKAAARAGGPKGFGSGKRAGAKGDDEEVSN